MDGYTEAIEGWCLSCSSLFSNCDDCKKDSITGIYKCTKCSKHYYINKYGNCEKCIVSKAIINGKCIECGDIREGGIENCVFCKENEKGDGIVCKQCKEGYILFIDKEKNTNTCLDRGNEDLRQFDSCLEITSEDNKKVCSRCKPQFSLLKEGKESKCAYTPTLFDSNFISRYLHHYYYDIFNKNGKKFANFVKNDYFFRPRKFLPCKESINIGTVDNPLYSCTKCYNVFENDEYDEYYFYDYYYGDYNDYYNYVGFDYLIFDVLYKEDFFLYQDLFYRYYGSMPVRIIDETNQNSYCIETNEDLENCAEATYKISKGREIYDCNKCLNDIDYEHLYNQELNIHYCLKAPTKCLVHFCKICQSNNNYFCSSCITSEYEVNKITGSCVKKTEVEPIITWKDIYRLSMNGEMEINSKIIQGPCFLMRGITCSQISSKHAFLILLTFEIKDRLRNLEEQIEVPTICQISETIEETSEDINIVDYECIGTIRVDSSYNLVGIKGDNIDKNILNDPFKNFSYYTEDDIPTRFIIERTKSDNKTFTDIPFNFPFNGNLKGKKASILPNNVDTQLEIYGFNETAKCNFLRNENLNANLSCAINMYEQELNNLTFKNPEIKIGDYDLFLNHINKIYFTLEKSEEIDTIPLGKKSSSNHNTLIIVLSVIIGVIVLAALIVGLLYFLKIKKTKDINQDSNIKNINEKDNTGNKDYNASSTNINN